MLKHPDKMEDLIYFTRRTLEPKGRAMAWAFKKSCPKCKKALMGKPVEKGKIRIRATEYVCPACGYTEEKLAHEATLRIFIDYVCPSCENKGEADLPYKRVSWEGTKAFVAICDKCKGKIGVSKKLKDPKKKGAAVQEADDDDD
jgi:predicted RNA-binding Zn-ribbon protein involved in translation (DUF1610 family)